MQNKYGGVTFLGTLQILFLVLKLTNTVSWSWWWVMSPYIFVVGLNMVIFFLCVFIVFVLKKA